MLTQAEVTRYAHLRRLRLVDQIWKDYLQDLLLHLLARKLPGFVFGGGTALWKLFGGDRFSEDIDGYAPSIPAELPATLQKELGYLGISCRTAKQRRTANMLFLSLALSFPSHPREVPIQVELLKTEPKRSETLALHSPYPDIPPIELRVLAPEELLANKVSAILGREKPRDVHDLFLLLRRGTAIDPALIRQKAPRFSLAILEARLERKRKDWRSLEPLVIGKLPLFEEERSSILRAFALLPRS